MYAVIFNYNLPQETQSIYLKLLTDGFEEKKIIVVDNGSDKAEKALSTNFALPFNVRFTGQSFMVLTYLLEFIDFDNVLLITTSAKLDKKINYYEAAKKVNSFMNVNNVGFIAASLIGGKTIDTAPEQLKTQLSMEYTPIYHYQPITIIVSKKLITFCKEQKAAYFNLKLIRGWGIDRELQYIANIYNMKCYISKSFSIEWITNQTHKKNLADESLNNYQTAAEIEMNNVFNKKYGYNWNDLFISKFNYINDLSISSDRKLKKLIKISLIKLKLYKLIRKII